MEEGMATYSSIPVWRISCTWGAWQATVHTVRNSWTELKHLSIHTYRHTQAHTHILLALFLWRTQTQSAVFTEEYLHEVCSYPGKHMFHPCFPGVKPSETIPEHLLLQFHLVFIALWVSIRIKMALPVQPPSQPQKYTRGRRMFAS